MTMAHACLRLPAISCLHACGGPHRLSPYQSEAKRTNSVFHSRVAPAYLRSIRKSTSDRPLGFRSPHSNSRPYGASPSAIGAQPDGSSKCGAARQGSQSGATEPPPPPRLSDATLQRFVWSGFAIYVLWLLLLPFAPGDPVWAIQGQTLTDLLDLSLNFFFLLPAANAVGYHGMEAPTLHPSAEALFNLVNAWSLMFGPLLVNDRRRGRWGGSVEAIWSAQMFLTNVFLFPYMALRLNERPDSPPARPNFLGSALRQGLTKNSKLIGSIGAVVGAVSLLWLPFGRPESDFGRVAERWQYLVHYVTTDRPAYAFVWDLFLYTAFQAWVMEDNLEEIREGGQDERVELLRVLRFFPFFGLAAFLILRPVRVDE